MTKSAGTCQDCGGPITEVKSHGIGRGRRVPRGTGRFYCPNCDTSFGQGRTADGAASGAARRREDPQK